MINWNVLLFKYIAEDDGNVVLTHVVQVQGVATPDWKQVHVDADNGRIANIMDFVADASVSLKFTSSRLVAQI